MVFHKQNILIIEDELETLDLMVEIFESKFSSVFSATNGYEAIEIFKNNKIDAILCDINIPKLNGLETIIITPLKNKHKLINLHTAPLDV